MADTTLYKQIVLEWGQDTDSLIWGMGYSPDNGEHFYVLNTTYGRKYRTEDGDRIWPFLVDKVKAVLDWSTITNKPDLALKTDLTWTNVTGKPDVALKSDVAAVSAVASSASAKADSNAKLIAGKASQADLDNVSKTASSALDKATSNANALTGKVNKADLVWTNITNRPDVDKIASQASQAVVTANTAQSQASAAGQAADSAATVASQANSTATQASQSASGAVSVANQAKSTADSVNNRLNSMQIGGRNLVSGTAEPYVMGYGIPNTTWQDGYAYLKLPANTTSSEVLPQNPHTFYHTLTKGTTYTQTIWFETDAKLGNSSGVQITWFTNVGHDPQPATLINLGENRYKLYSTYTWTGKSDNNVRLFDTEYLDYAFDLSTGTYFKFGKLMLEEGNVSTDWTPAPEDVQTQIDANKTAAANAQTSANDAQNTASSAQTSANSALSKANNAQNTANSAQTSANNAQNTANSAQSTANTAIKVSETLKDLGNYTATASGTTANSPTTGLPRTSGVSMTQVYNNGYPTSYGNVLNVAGSGTGQLLLGWSGNDNTTEHLWYRSHRDTSTGGWGTWQKIAYVSDLTWPNISGKPDVATKSDLTWANISGKPNIPSTFNGTITNTSTDFNNLTTEGHYDIQISPSYQGKNGPNDSNWGLLDVKAAGRMIVQTYYGDAYANVYVRNRRDGTTWTAWREITFWS